jgi:hypothetical protein
VMSDSTAEASSAREDRDVGSSGLGIALAALAVTSSISGQRDADRLPARTPPRAPPRTLRPGSAPAGRGRIRAPR